MARLERGLLVLSLAALLGLAGWASWLDGKAWLAQHLIAHAWQTTLDQGAPSAPGPGQTPGRWHALPPPPEKPFTYWKAPVAKPWPSAPADWPAASAATKP